MTITGFAECADVLERMARTRDLAAHDLTFLRDLAVAIRRIPASGHTLAIIWNELGFSHVVTDMPGLDVISVDTSPHARDDRLFRMNDAVKRVTTEEMKKVLGNGPVGEKGDRPNEEQAIAAILAADPVTGKPDLRLVKDE